MRRGEMSGERIYEIWSEGYAATGECGKATFHGRVRARSFGAACEKIFRGDSNFNSKELSYWACKLFDNEKDARRAFG